jgi:hypothetical protein
MDNDMRAVEAIVLPENISSRRYSKAMNKTFPVLLGQHAWESNLAQALDVMLSYYAGTHHIDTKENSGMGTTTKDAYDPPPTEDPSIAKRVVLR